MGARMSRPGSRPSSKPSSRGGSAKSGGSDRSAAWDSESDREEYDPAKRGPGWFETFKARLKRAVPQRWRKDGNAMTPKVEEKLAEKRWRPNRDAGIPELAAMAKDRSDPLGLEKVVATLTQPFFWRPSEGEDFAIQAAAAECEKSWGGELFVKGWVMIKLNDRGKEQERVLILTDLAYYTVKYNYDNGKVSHVQRHAMSSYVSLRCGQVMAKSWSISNTVYRALESSDGKMFGFVYTMVDDNASRLRQALADMRGADPPYYERAFRPHSVGVPYAVQQDIVHEITWAFYAVALRLARHGHMLMPPTDAKSLYRPSKLGNNSVTLAFNSFKLGIVPPEKKRDAASRKHADEITQYETLVMD